MIEKLDANEVMFKGFTIIRGNQQFFTTEFDPKSAIEDLVNKINELTDAANELLKGKP